MLKSGHLKDSYVAILLLIATSIKSASAVFCTYWDSINRQYRSTYCPHSCCLTAYSIQDSCCFGWSWGLTIIAIVFPITISFIVFLVLCLIFLKRRQRTSYPGGIIMYVDPRRTGGLPASAIFPMPPPNYNESNATASINSKSKLDAPDSPAPPAYSSIINTISSPTLQNENRLDQIKESEIIEPNQTTTDELEIKSISSGNKERKSKRSKKYVKQDQEKIITGQVNQSMNHDEINETTKPNETKNENEESYNNLDLDVKL